MKKFFDSGAAFFVVGGLFMVLSLVMERPAVFISLGVVFFLLGLGVRSKSAKSSQPPPAS